MKPVDIVNNALDMIVIRDAFQRTTETLYEGEFYQYSDGDYVNEIQQYHWEGWHDGWKNALAYVKHDYIKQQLYAAEDLLRKIEADYRGAAVSFRAHSQYGSEKEALESADHIKAFLESEANEERSPS